MENNPYETQRLVDEYLLFHYGTPEELLPYDFGPISALEFAARTVSENLPSDSVARALDVGCAVGRSSLELSNFCESVIGIDYSKAFIEAADAMKSQGELAYRRHEEGAHYADCFARIPNCAPERVQFEVGDAMNLRGDLGSFDIVHAANLLCRLPEPVRFLQRLPNLVRSGGSLVLTTPCTWLEEYTPKANWPQESTFDWLKDELESAFTLVETKDMPFLIREHARKYQWTVALGSIWRRH